MEDVFARSNETVLALGKDQRGLVLDLVASDRLSAVSGAFLWAELVLVDRRVANRTLFGRLAFWQRGHGGLVLEVAGPQRFGYEELRAEVALQP